MDAPSTSPYRLPLAVKQLHWGKAGLVIALFIYGMIGALHYEAFSFIHGANLLIHEFGHLFFSISGDEVIIVLGGSIMQVFIPVLFTLYFLWKRQYYSGAVTLFWVGQNFFDVAVYVRDARALQLPLVGVGGDGGEIIHDWNFLLDKWGLLLQDIAIAHVLYFIGGLLLLASLGFGVYYSFHHSFQPCPPPQPLAPAAATPAPVKREKREIVCTDFMAEK